MIKLKHPPLIDSNGVLSKNPFFDFDPQNSLHYPKGSGIYIYGIKVEVDGEMKFVPICVGESKDLKKRLYNDHYIGKFKNPSDILNNGQQLKLGDNKELWDFSKKKYSIKHIQLVYNQMYNYNSTKSVLRYNLLRLLSELIYFQDFRFYENLFNPPANVKNDLNIVDTVIEIQKRYNNQVAKVYVSKIKAALDNFTNNFYFVYANTVDNEDINLSSQEARLNIEVKLNQALIDQFDIYTTADNRRTGRDFPIQFDLSLISNQLVNLK